jgi:predicted cupin superfamily sugar epimerase
MGKERPGAAEIIRLLGLRPLPEEGGYYREIYRSEELLSPGSLPDRFGAGRAVATSIYYLITPEAFSALHRLASDEVFHFYLGDPVEMLRLRPSGAGDLLLMGCDLATGQRPQVVVPRKTWQGCRLAAGGEYALMGCSVAPGFDFEDYEHGDRQALLHAYPAFAEAILRMTR